MGSRVAEPGRWQIQYEIEQFLYHEAWLLDRYEGYAAYRERVRRRFLPGLW